MIKRLIKKDRHTDLDMIDDVYGAMMTDAPLRYRAVVWGALLLVASFIVWASFAELDRVTRGSGKVIPSSHVQLIQSLDGGILQAMFVDEGQLVEKGMPLARIDDTRFRSDLAQHGIKLTKRGTGLIPATEQARHLCHRRHGAA